MGAVQPPGYVIHLTGQVAWNADSEIVGLNDVRAQTQQCYENIRILLQEVGGNLHDIVSVTTYFLDLQHLPVIQDVRSTYFSHAPAPVSTSVRVAGLGHPDFLVELTPIAVVPEERFKSPSR